MKVEWVIIAEGLGTAGNGAITAIGINQVLIIASTLPINTKRAIMVHLVDDDDSLADKELGLGVKVLSPSGKILVAQTAPARTGKPQWPDIPVTFDIFTEIGLLLAEYGTYVVDVEVTLPDGTGTQAQANFYVRKPPVNE